MTNALQSTQVVFSLLNYFTVEKPNWGVRELARVTHRSPSVIQRAINVLEQEGFLLKNAISKNYQLGFRCIELGQLANSTLSFTELAELCLRPVVDETGETVFIYRQRDDYLVCNFILESAEHIRFTATVGDRLPLHQAPFTQVTLAFMPQAEQDAYLDRHNLADDPTLKEALHKWAQQGYASSCEAWQPHTQGISVPLFNRQDIVAGSLCIAASSLRGELTEYKILLQSAAKKLRSII
ncbi:helix-turn-helix domain-containing protein [Enterobacteriaceae bacterium RIT691]|nr:helix-turn-helix domain-containing protein [Enterobacteriaceae bacterium RIT691]